MRTQACQLSLPALQEKKNAILDKATARKTENQGERDERHKEIEYVKLQSSSR